MPYAPASPITGLLIGTDDTITTVDVPMSVYSDDDYTEPPGFDRRAIAQMLGCDYVEHCPVKYPSSDPDGVGMLCDESGRINGSLSNRIARKVVAALNGMAEAEVTSLHGPILLVGWAHATPQDVSLTGDQIEEIERIAAAVKDEPALADTEAQVWFVPIG